MSTAIAVVALAGLAWIGFWLALGTLASVVDSRYEVTLTFKGFVGNALFLTSVGCAAYTIATTL